MAQQIQQKVEFENPFLQIPKAEVRFPDRRGVKPQVWEIAPSDLKLKDGKYATPSLIGMTREDAIHYVDDHFSGDNAQLLPHYVLMEIAQNPAYEKLFNVMRGNYRLTNTYIRRENGKANMGIFGQPKFSAEVEDLDGEVRHLDENLWPASKRRKVTRPTYAYTNSSGGGFAVILSFGDDGDVCVFSDDWLDYSDSGALLRVGRQTD